jgi:hypothetical protein
MSYQVPLPIIDDGERLNASNWLEDARRGLEDILAGRVVDADTALQALQERRMSQRVQRQNGN